MSFPCHFCVPIFSEMCLITYNVLLLNFLTVYYYNTFYLKMQICRIYQSFFNFIIPKQSIISFIHY